MANAGGVGVISSAGLGLIYKDRAASVAEAAIEGLKEELRKAREKTKLVPIVSSARAAKLICKKLK